MARRLPYVPIDVLIERPRIQLLRVMRWFDWADLSELLEAFAPHLERNSYSSAIADMVTAGLAERSGPRHKSLYRITARGRRLYHDLLNPKMMVA